MTYQSDMWAREGKRKFGVSVKILLPIFTALTLLLYSFNAVAWFDDVETGTNGWTHYWISGSNITDMWAISTSRYYSIGHSWYSGMEIANWIDGGDTALETPSLDITNATSSYLSFWHWYDFDYSGTWYLDGGIVEINDGTGWTQISPDGGYPNILSTGYLNPLEGLSAYGGSHRFWEQETFNISSYVGNVVSIRFHVGWDYGTTGLKEGWYIDDIEVTNSTLPQHELSIGSINAPSQEKPLTLIPISATIRNNGENDETNITVNLTADGTIVDSGIIPFLKNQTSIIFSLNWTPIIEKTYLVCMEVAPVAGEIQIGNNKVCKNVIIRSIKGIILIDQTHSTDNASYYSILIADLIADGYQIKYLSTSPITASALSGHDVLITPQPHSTYSASEQSAIQGFVSSGHGLFVIGDDTPSVFNTLTSFAGISWTSGGSSGITTSITPHQITNGVSSVSLTSPMSRMTISGAAISLVRDVSGYNAVTISTSPGRVAGISDEDPMTDGSIYNADNERLALNIIEWLLGIVYEHDVAIVDFTAPSSVEPGVTFNVDATIKNLGLRNESNIKVDFKVNSVLQSNKTISSLIPGASTNVNFNYSSLVEGLYNVAIEIQPVPSENFTGNNYANQTVFIGYVIFVGIFNHPTTVDISYWIGSNQNMYSIFQTILDSDPLHRFDTTIITDLSSTTLSSLDVLLLPDNAVPNTYLSDVASFYSNRHGIVGIDSAVCYLAYSGFLWPSAAGTNGYSTYWTPNSQSFDQRILISHDITHDYTVGGMYSSTFGQTSMYVSMLPADAIALTGSSMNPNYIYVAAREDFGKGRVVELGPFADSMLSLSLYEMVRDAVEWAGGAVPVDHDIAVTNFDLPKYVQPNDMVNINAEIRNIGLNNEIDVKVNFTIDGVLKDQRTIVSISPGQIKTYVFSWTPVAEKTYSVCIQASFVPNENVTSNNKICRNVDVKKYKAFILFDQSHNSIPMSWYSSLVALLRLNNYVVDPSYTTPITSASLAGYDALILPEPRTTYTSAELSVISNYVAQGHGLLLMGDYSYTMYNDITGFAGITWTMGGSSGMTTSITPHDVTKGVASVYLPGPSLRLTPSLSAISLVRDVMGNHILAVSEPSGRVGALSDEEPFMGFSLNMSDNKILAMNLIEWLIGRRFDHDIDVSDLAVNSPLEKWFKTQITIKIKNIGLNNETNVLVKLLVDGIQKNSTVISQLPVKATKWVTFDYTPQATGTYNITGEAEPVPNENATDNNMDWVIVNVHDTTPPRTPENLRAFTTTNPTSIRLTWSPNTELDLTKYSIYMSVDGAHYYFEANVDPSICSYTDTGLLPGAIYYYQITASDDVPNESPRSSPVMVMPGTDHDGDGIIDIIDPDDDNDNIPDDKDHFPWDSDEWRDFDGDGIGDNSDDDDDGDGVLDTEDAFPYNPNETRDSDNDGVGDNADQDDDNDGIPDSNDRYPFDENEWLDTDGDGIGNNADTDDDGDGIPDSTDPNPLIPSGGITTTTLLDLDNIEKLLIITMVLLIILTIMAFIAISYYILGKRRKEDKEIPQDEESSKDHQ